VQTSAKLTVLVWLLIQSALIAYAQPYADPRSFGFDIPTGPVTSGGRTCVTTNDEQGRAVVARVHAQVGEHRIVMLPDGRLVARPPDDASTTDREFVPTTRKQLAEELAARFPGFTIKTSRHYVFVYNTSANFAQGTMRILETMLPGLRRFGETQGIAVHMPEVPLVAIMFRTEAEFRAYGQLPSGVVAYYDPATNHVVMYEESPLWRVQPELAIQQSISTIAHEGAHQILHNIGVQQRLSRWPMWLSEGLAEYLAPTTFGKELRWKGAGEVNDLRMFELEVYLKGRPSDVPDGQLVEHTVAAAGLTSTGYASAWALTHYLARSHKEGFKTQIQEVSRLQPLEVSGEMVPPGLIPNNLELFRRHFTSSPAKTEEGLAKHLKALPYRDPFAAWPHWVAYLEVPNGRTARREANLFHSPILADKWLEEALSSTTPTQRASAKTVVREYANRALAEQSARSFLAN